MWALRWYRSLAAKRKETQSRNKNGAGVDWTEEKLDKAEEEEWHETRQELNKQELSRQDEPSQEPTQEEMVVDCPLEIAEPRKDKTVQSHSELVESNMRLLKLHAHFGSDIQIYTLSRAIVYNEKWRESEWMSNKKRLSAAKHSFKFLQNLCERRNKLIKSASEKVSTKHSLKFVPPLCVPEIFIRAMYLIDIFMLNNSNVKLQGEICYAALQLAAKADDSWIVREIAAELHNDDRKVINNVERMMLLDCNYDMTQPTVLNIVQLAYANVQTTRVWDTLPAALSVYAVLSGPSACRPHTLLAAAICKLLIQTTTDIQWTPSICDFFGHDESSIDQTYNELLCFYHELHGSMAAIKAMGEVEVFNKWSWTAPGREALRRAFHREDEEMGEDINCSMCSIRA
ncbi:hypothetical protein WR25_09925 [Diploscapter pachys]|uniref:Uncharacterized protein n=1 Tax=Diploscapter pachys TaxID=2018661 RepID=A0A2A2J0S5_9BILA|nr:hypothetical protein WR25_09925 [Diploscapter pachys]